MGKRAKIGVLGGIKTEKIKPLNADKLYNLHKNRENLTKIAIFC